MRTPRQQFWTAPWALAALIAFGAALVVQPALAQDSPKSNTVTVQPQTPPAEEPGKTVDKTPAPPTGQAQTPPKVSGKGKKTLGQAPQADKTHAVAPRGKGIPEPTVVLKPGEVPKIKFDMVSWDFGRVAAGSDVEHDYWFTNTGTGPLEILRVKPG